MTAVTISNLLPPDSPRRDSVEKAVKAALDSYAGASLCVTLKRHDTLVFEHRVSVELSIAAGSVALSSFAHDAQDEEIAAHRQRLTAP